MQKFSVQIGKTNKIFNLNLSEVNVQNLKFRQAYSIKFGFILLRSAENKPMSVTYDISYGGVRTKGKIQTQKYGSIKTVFPNFSA